MEIGHRIREARTRAGLSQKKLATAVGVSRVAVSLWENGTNTPSRENIQSVAKELNIPIDWLLNGDSVTPKFTANLYDHNETRKIRSVEPVKGPIDFKFYSEVIDSIVSLYQELNIKIPSGSAILGNIVYQDAYYSGDDMPQRRAALKAILKGYRREPWRLTRIASTEPPEPDLQNLFDE